MSVNYGKIYSMLSETENRAQQEVDDVILKFKELKMFGRVSDAKEFLQNNYGIVEGEKSLNGIGILKIEETDKMFSAVLKCQNQIIECHFKKKEVLW